MCITNGCLIGYRFQAVTERDCQTEIDAYEENFVGGTQHRTSR
jgi:hypothetical protein